jgi:hypothetical protein
MALAAQLAASPPELVTNEFCAYTHALTALFLAASRQGVGETRRSYDVAAISVSP